MRASGRLGSAFAAMLAAGNFGGVPIYQLSNKSRARLTAAPRGHSTNWAKPHQGKRECARRVRQMARDAR